MLRTSVHTRDTTRGILFSLGFPLEDNFWTVSSPSLAKCRCVVFFHMLILLVWSLLRVRCRPPTQNPRARHIHVVPHFPSPTTRHAAHSAATARGRRGPAAVLGAGFAARRAGALPARAGPDIRRGQVAVGGRAGRADAGVSQRGGDDAQRGASLSPYHPLHSRDVFLYRTLVGVTTNAKALCFLFLFSFRNSHIILPRCPQAALERYLNFTRGDSGLTLDQ